MTRPSRFANHGESPGHIRLARNRRCSSAVGLVTVAATVERESDDDDDDGPARFLELNCGSDFLLRGIRDVSDEELEDYRWRG